MGAGTSVALRGFLACTLLARAAIGLAQEVPDLSGIVTAVFDGDVLRVQLSSGPFVVRLRNVDAPELKQPGGREARMALHQRTIGKRVRLTQVAKDGEGRVAAVVYAGDENINAWMVKQGHAWAYRQEADTPEYCIWENAARSLKRGFWGGEESLAPWEWRQGGKGKAIMYTNYQHETTDKCIAAMSASTAP